MSVNIYVRDYITRTGTRHRNFFKLFCRDGREYYTAKEEDEDLSKKNRFWVGADGIKFYKADPITEEERREAEELWDAMSLPGTSKGKIRK